MVEANQRFCAPTLTRILRFTVTNSSCFCCRIYIVIGITAAAFISIPVIVACCLLCSFCPAYKYRHKRAAVYGAGKYQQMKMLFYLHVAIFSSSIKCCLASILVRGVRFPSTQLYQSSFYCLFLSRYMFRSYDHLQV
jgi:hypothetical protein